MYFVEDGTTRCGYYQCKNCDYRFLSEETEPHIPCPLCESEIDCEIGPDESLEEVLNTATLIEIVEGADEVYQLDKLLSVAFDESDDNWL